MLNELLNKIKKLSYLDRLELLKDEKVINTLFLLNEKTTPNDFQKIFEFYKLEDILNIFNINIIKKISNTYKDQEYIFLNILKNIDQNIFEKYLNNNDYLKEFILLKGEDLYKNLNFSYDTLLNLINYCNLHNIDYNKTCLNDITYFSLKSKSLQEKFFNEPIDNIYKIKMFMLFDKDLVTKYIKENIVYLSLKDIDRIIRYTDIDLHPSLYENKDFFKEILLKNSIYETRLEINNLSNKINVDYFDKKLDEIENKILSLYNKNNMLIEYQKDSSLTSFFLEKVFNTNNIDQKRTKKLIFQIIIDKFFQDSLRNVCLNISEILEFNKNKLVISKDKLIFYKEIIELFSKDANYLIDFYNKYKDSTLVSSFYDDLSLSKESSYQLMKDSCLKIESIKNLKDKELSSKYNLDIYKLNDMPFNMLVSCRSTIPIGEGRSPRNCYSLISNYNLNVFNEKGIIYGFNDFQINNIMHVYEGDSFSENNSFKSTNLINRIRIPDEILSSNMMNEIQIKNPKIGENKYTRLLPNYIICFNELNEKSKNAATILNIPIIIINKDKNKTNNKLQALSNYNEEYTNALVSETIYQDKIL